MWSTKNEINFDNILAPLRNAIPSVRHLVSGLVCHCRTISALMLDQNYINLKSQVIKAERRVLKELGFCVHVKHPHKVIDAVVFKTAV